MREVFVVVALPSAAPGSAPDTPPRCRIVSADVILPAPWRRVYGPARYFDCIEWTMMQGAGIAPAWDLKGPDAEAEGDDARG